MMSIVTTGPETGYYVDIFRSRKEQGGDKMHDYFYHNLGQTLTLDPRYLDFVQKVTDVYLQRLPEDYVPYWDFDAPDIPNAPRDASAACITASALLELSAYLPGKKGNEYKDAAIKMLASLSSDQYQCGKSKPAFLLHSTGHMPNNSEVDASIIYADYYYIEALMRLKNLIENK